MRLPRIAAHELRSRARAASRPFFTAVASRAAQAAPTPTNAKAKQQQQKQGKKKQQQQQQKKKKQTPPAKKPAPELVAVVLPADLPATTPLYLDDTHIFTHESARVLGVSAGPTVGKTTVVLDATIFHPQGGGQPTDLGVMRCAASGAEFNVEMVTVDRAIGIVHHVGTFATPAQLEVGAAVALTIEEAQRRQCAVMHSGGHLLDTAMVECGMGHLEPGKGYHFNPSGCYVEYIGLVAAEERADLIAKLNVSLAALVAADIATSITTLDLSTADGAGALCGLMVHPPAEAPAATPGAAPLRVVCVGGERGCGCGGTHVKSTAELVGVHVTKCKVKKGRTKLSYYVGEKRE